MGGTDQGAQQNYAQMLAKLYQAIQKYSLSKGIVSETPGVVCFNEPGASGQYFFIDPSGTPGNTNASCPTDVGTWAKVGSNTAFTGRLERATYNYKFLVQDPGAWADNPRYVWRSRADPAVGGATLAPSTRGFYDK
jgi:hypothetical protein